MQCELLTLTAAIISQGLGSRNYVPDEVMPQPKGKEMEGKKGERKTLSH